MITVTEYQTFINDMVTAVGGFSDIVMVADESHATNKLKDKPGTLLVAVYPSGFRSGAIDAVREGYSALLFIVEKPIAGQKSDAELALYQKLQNRVNAIINYIDGESEDGCSILRNYVPGETNIDPENNIFGGFAGWSLSMVF